MSMAILLPILPRFVGGLSLLKRLALREPLIFKVFLGNFFSHVTGAAVFYKPIAFKTLKNKPGLRRAHIELMRGLPAASLVYCTKEDVSPFIHGDLPQQGKRSDINDALDVIREGGTMSEVADQCGPVLVKYYRGLSVYKSLVTGTRDVDDPPTVYWLFGETGSGKTRCAWEFGHALYGYSIWANSDGLQWFDGYDGQAVAIFDDFRSKRVPFSFFLRVLDRYPLSVPIKGAYVHWKPKLIIITTPGDICSTFSKRAEHIPEDVHQLERRVTAQYSFPNDRKRFMSLLDTEDPRLDGLRSGEYLGDTIEL